MGVTFSGLTYKPRADANGVGAYRDFNCGTGTDHGGLWRSGQVSSVFGLSAPNIYPTYYTTWLTMTESQCMEGGTSLLAYAARRIRWTCNDPAWRLQVCGPAGSTIPGTGINFGIKTGGSESYFTTYNTGGSLIPANVGVGWDVPKYNPFTGLLWRLDELIDLGTGTPVEYFCRLNAGTTTSTNQPQEILSAAYQGLALSGVGGNHFLWLVPTLTSVVASSGPTAGGTAVTLTGDEFFQSGTAPTVLFGGTAATSVVRVSATSITCVTPAHSSGAVDVVVTVTYAVGETETATLAGGFTYTSVSPSPSNMYKLTLPWQDFYQFGLADPFYTLPNARFYNGVYYPKGTVYTWVAYAGTPPTDKGWWLSINQDFAGAAFIISNGRPKDPRSFAEITAFTGGTNNGMMGGFPGPSCVFNNKLMYATGGYTVGTDAPAIRITDGVFDREVVQIPKTAAGVIPKAVMTMLAANGTIYLTTLDSGSSSADWSGRVFSLDLESGQLAPVGAALTVGHVPYALAWHSDRLWCGTNRQSSAAAGKIFYFRPGIDAAWTDDYTLSSSTVAGCTSLVSYKGLLYVGTSNAAAAFAKVLVRSELGVYSTTKTASGGTAVANNAILAMAEFGGNLYATFWNNDTTAVSLIYKFDNTTWTTAYTGATTTLVPFIALPIDRTILFAIGGGISYTGTLLSSTNGTSWTDRTAFLSEGSPASTALPVFGVVMA